MLAPEYDGASPFAIAQATLEAVTAYRKSIPGDVVLVWRVEPELRIEGDVTRLYTRLCFEHDPRASA